MENNKMDKSNNSRDNRSGNGEGPKFNSYWIYGVIALVLLGMNFLAFDTTKNEPINEHELKTMVKKGDVKSLKIINKAFAHIYLKESSLGKEEYKDAGKSSFGNPRPHFTMTIGDVRGFEERWAAFNETLEPQNRIYYTHDVKRDFLTPILSWVLPIAIIIIIWIWWRVLASVSVIITVFTLTLIVEFRFWNARYTNTQISISCLGTIRNLGINMNSKK